MSQTSRTKCQRVLRSTALGLLSGCLLLSGCGPGADGEADRPPTIPVSGKVTYQGQAVEGATVLFVPKAAGGKAAAGKTDSKGMFSMSTFDSDDGAVAGDYNVTVTKLKAATDGAVADVESSEYVDPAMTNEKKTKAITKEKKKKSIGPEQLLPEKYAKPDTSGLTAAVPPSGKVTDLKFELVD